MTEFSPREIVSELDRYIVGQGEAKRAVAIALRNRWRRLRLSSPMREEVMPKNILMIGPTGCGKTEIAAINIADIFGKGQRTKPKRLTVAEAREPLVAAEAEKLLDQDAIVRDAIGEVESNGIVFLDEIDKICAREGRGGADVSREGVQRDLLPLIEGTTIATKHGQVKTDHILFIASGAFHVAKPSDLLPELQGRLPIRVELQALTRDDFRRILTEPEASLIKQYVALMQTEGVTLDITPDAVDALADVAVAAHSPVEDNRARR